MAGIDDAITILERISDPGIIAEKHSSQSLGALIALIATFTEQEIAAVALLAKLDTVSADNLAKLDEVSSDIQAKMDANTATLVTAIEDAFPPNP